MKHAGDETLNTLEDLLDRLRKLEGILERKRGVFYRKGRAFLHFHEDPEGIFADLQTGNAWIRIKVNAVAQRAALVRRAREILRNK